MHRLTLFVCASILALSPACTASDGSQGSPLQPVDSGAPSSGEDAADSAPATDTSEGTPLGEVSPNTATGSLPPLSIGIPAVYTRSNDVARTGANLAERVLTTSNVNKDSFGLLFSRSVVGQIYAQPLYAPDVEIPDKGWHDVVIVATEHNDVYAFDASDPDATDPLWHVHLAEPVPTGDILDSGYCSDLSPEIGITATPTIDPEHGLIYVETKEKTGDKAYTHRLHALDLATGREHFGSPAEIVATVPGTGDGSVDGLLSFNPRMENSRAGLVLSHGVIWLAYAGHCDGPPYHGWVFAYDATTLRQLGVWVDTANTSDGGIWMGGQGIAADETGDVYVLTGNAPYDDSEDPYSLGDSFTRLRIDSEGISVVDWFTPFNEETLGLYDLDLGSIGAMLVPGTSWAIGGGKEGKLYVVDRDSMGKFHDGDDSQILQSFQASQADPEYGHPLFGSPVFWNDLLYIWAMNDDVRVYRKTASGFDTKLAGRSAIGVQPAMPGGILSLSADGTNAGTGILWASHPVSDAGRTTSSGVLRAFDASDVSRELWDSEQVPDRDHVGTFAKFCPPTIAAGRVYMATFSDKLQVYGLLP
jgi:hypothetical protein